jgi:Mg2+ and Co2+ transporter CorA
LAKANAAMNSKQEMELDGFLKNAHLYKISHDRFNRRIQKIESSRIMNTKAAISAINLRHRSLLSRQIEITFISIPTTSNKFFMVQQSFQEAFNLGTPADERLLASRRSSGVIISDQNRAILETPFSSGPYVFMLLTRHGNTSRGFVVHDLGDYTLNHSVPSVWEVQEHYRLHHQSEGTSITDDDFIRLFMSKLGLQYLKAIRSRVNAIEERLEDINNQVKVNDACNLSESMLKLNECSDDVRSSRLEQQAAFGFEVLSWSSHFLDIERYDTEAFQLLRLDPKPRNLYSTPLRDIITEVRARIADIAALQRQEREEQQWKREERRWKEREEFDKRKDLEQLEREKTRQDAQDAYEKQREQEQKQQRSEELQRQIAREALEDQRAKDAKRLQDLSIEMAEESLRDSRTMRGIAWLTMAFLPATFVSSFFGMNFFTGVPGTPEFAQASRNVWVFFVVAVPISAMVLAGFWYWDRKTQLMVREERENREKARPGSRKVTG